MDDFSDRLNHKVIKTWDKTIGTSNIVIIKDEYDMKDLEKVNPIWAASLKASDVKSLILVPLHHMRKVLGYLFITNFNTDKVVETKEFIELTAYFISSEVANNILMEKLEFMSNVDTLTGLRNRNSMNNRVDLFVSGEMKVRAPLGSLFADLNGLKQKNDSGSKCNT